MDDLRTALPAFDPEARLAAAPDPWDYLPMPAVRPGPPWAMTESIAAQPALAGRIVARLVADGSAAALAAALREAAAAGAPVVVTGCGTSEHAAMGVAAILRDGWRAAGLAGDGPRSVQAFELSLEPSSWWPGDRDQPRGRDGGDARRDGGVPWTRGPGGGHHRQRRLARWGSPPASAWPPWRWTGPGATRSATRRRSSLRPPWPACWPEARPTPSGRRPACSTASRRRGRRGPGGRRAAEAIGAAAGAADHLLVIALWRGPGDGPRARAQGRGGGARALRGSRPRDVPARPPPGDGSRNGVSSRCSSSAAASRPGPSGCARPCAPRRRWACGLRPSSARRRRISSRTSSRPAAGSSSRTSPRCPTRRPPSSGPRVRCSS